MADTVPILYTFRRCPYAMRARMALAASGEPFEWREILLKDKPEAMLSASGKGTVPVLVLPDGAVIDESLDIMLWALSQADPMGLLPVEAQVRTFAFELIARNDGPFKGHLDRYKYATRYEGVDAIVEREAGLAFLAELDSRLTESTFLAGGRCGLADLAIFPFVRQFRIADPAYFDARSFRALHGWLGVLTNSRLFLSIMPKRPPWAPGDAPLIFRGGIYEPPAAAGAKALP